MQIIEFLIGIGIPKRHTLALGFNYDDIDYKQIKACWDYKVKGIYINTETDFWRLHISDNDYFFLFSMLNHEYLHSVFTFSDIVTKSIDKKPDGTFYHAMKGDYDILGLPTPLLRQLDQTRLDEF